MCWRARARESSLLAINQTERPGEKAISSRDINFHCNARRSSPNRHTTPFPIIIQYQSQYISNWLRREWNGSVGLLLFTQNIYPNLEYIFPFILSAYRLFCQPICLLTFPTTAPVSKTYPILYILIYRFRQIINVFAIDEIGFFVSINVIS